MSEELPKQELLTKLLSLTQSSNDSEALVAIRKANALLSSAGWSWEKLIAGKIRVVADPFKSAPIPEQRTDSTAARMTTPRPAEPRVPQPRPQYPPNPFANQRTSWTPPTPQPRGRKPKVEPSLNEL